MAHRTTHRRNLAPPPPPSSSMDSTPTTSFSATPSHHHHHQHHHPTSKPDLTKPSSLLNHFSTLNLDHKRSLHSLDTHFQANPMTSSAIVDSSKSSFLTPKTHHHPKFAPKEKPHQPVKKTPKEKPHKPSSLQVDDSISKNIGGFDCNKEDDDDDDVKRPSVSVALTRGRRRSFCGSHVDLGDVFAINGVKVVSADMPPFMQIHAVDCARKAYDSMEKFTSKTLALTLKKEFDGVYGPAWHCIVGTSFGSFVTHSVGGFLYFSMDQKLYILLFKTTVQKAD